MLDAALLKPWVFWAGVGQIVLILGSLAIPRVLQWNKELEPLNPLTRQMFWVYSGYIWTTNLSFGLLSALAPELLLRPDPLSAMVNAFIAVYWGARVLIQFFYFDRSSAPQGPLYTVAEIALVLLFNSLTIVYSLAGWCCLQELNG